VAVRCPRREEREEGEASSLRGGVTELRLNDPEPHRSLASGLPPRRAGASPPASLSALASTSFVWYTHKKSYEPLLDSSVYELEKKRKEVSYDAR
jgi:hypothetical protein